MLKMGSVLKVAVCGGGGQNFNLGLFHAHACMHACMGVNTCLRSSGPINALRLLAYVRVRTYVPTYIYSRDSQRSKTSQWERYAKLLDTIFLLQFCSIPYHLFLSRIFSPSIQLEGRKGKKWEERKCSKQLLTVCSHTARLNLLSPYIGIQYRHS